MDTPGFAFVIGGGSGISKAVCVAFAKGGVQGILVADINIKTAEQTVKDCTAVATNKNFRAEAFHIDVTDEASVKSATARIVSTFGRIDYCVNGAGVLGEVAPVANSPLESFRRTMDINVQGTFLVLGSVTAAMTSQEPQAVDPNVPARGSSRGAIVNLGSIASFIALPQSPQYVASKHAVIGLTKSAALDNVGNGIRVNCVCPSFVETPMMRNLFAAAPPMEQAILSQLPMGRLALPEEVADLIVFLCSSKSSYANGGVFTLDGAMTVGPHVSV